MQLAETFPANGIETLQEPPEFKFQIEDRVALEILANNLPHRIFGTVQKRQSINRIGNVYQIRPEGFSRLLMQAGEGELELAPQTNGTHGQNLRKK